ncbi:MAG: hypothetical protein EB127_31160, partial [Alphaproteobacteria bacterium]|nr:hypothetical protein [Alphaproteobacteria bacterium]
PAPAPVQQTAGNTNITDMLRRWGLSEVKDWFPSWHELGMYVVVTLILYLVGALMYYNDIQNKVKKTSQCYKDKNSVKSNGTFVADATNQRGDKLYSVKYNMGAKTYSVECGCPEGLVSNTFPNIDVFNLSTQSVQTIDNKMCSCEKQLYNPASDTIYYKGYPGIVRFMNTASLYTNAEDKQKKSDTAFFDIALNGDKSSI